MKQMRTNYAHTYGRTALHPITSQV